MHLSRLTLIVIALQLGWTARAQYWQPDPSFAPVLESGTTASALLLLPTAGGKLIVMAGGKNAVINGVQSASGLFRLNADGTVDRSFAPSDSVAFRALLAYPDGRILVEQAIDSVGMGVSRLFRLAVNGATDGTFQPVDVNVGAYGLQAQLLADGRILLSGLFTSVGGVAQTRMCVLNADGTVSGTFRSPFHETSLSVDYDHFNATVLPDGRFLAAGSFANPGSTQLHGAVRLFADGTVDETFNANAVPFPSNTKPDRIYPLHDGRMLVSYNNDPTFGAPVSRGILRLDTSGGFDPGFHAADVGAQPHFGPQQSDDKILYLAYDSGELRRLNSDGTNDPAFQTGHPSGGQLPVLDASGTAYINSPMTAARDASQCWIAHLLADGSLDPNYSPITRQQAQIQAFARQPDGKVIVVGELGYVNGEKVGAGFTVARLLADGSLDHSFNAAPVPFGALQEVSWLTVQPAGTVMTFGDPYSSALPSFVRYGATGATDPNFHLASGPRGDIRADSAGRIYGVTSNAQGSQLRRFSADGDLDPSYPPIALVAPSTFGVWPDGSAVATVQAPSIPEQTVRTLSRFRSDGSYDPAFQVDGMTLPNVLTAVVPLPGGGAIVIGAGSDSDRALTYLRLSSTGTVEYRYDANGTPSDTDPLRAREVGGVLYDALQAGSAPAGSRLRADFGVQFHTSVEVDASGTLTALDHRLLGEQTLSVLRRTSLTGPSVDPKPTVLSSTNTDPGDLSVGGTTTLTVHGTGLYPLTYQWTKDGVAIAGATSASCVIGSAQPSDGGNYSVTISNAYDSISSTPIAVSVSTTTSAPTFSSAYDPPNRQFPLGEASTLTVLGFGNPLPTLTWFHDGEPIVNPQITITPKRDRVFSSLLIGGTLADTGLYTVVATSPSGSRTSGTGIVGLVGTTKVTGAGSEVGVNIVHPNGNTYDQILLQGSAASVTADPGQVTRTSFVDLNGDIVQVEFAGAGTLSVVLAAESGPAVAENYNQPTVSYVRGHASIVIVNADETTNVTVFSVGRVTAYDPTGRFNIVQPISPTNDPANNGSPLFEGHGNTAYDGVADLAYIAILSRNGKFGGIRAGNASFFASKGFTGIQAPNVLFQGPVYIGNIDGHEDAAAGLILGAAVDTRIIGGNLAQANGRSVQVSGITQLKFVPGTTSDNRLLPAQANEAVLVQNGVDVTAQIVVPPAP